MRELQEPDLRSCEDIQSAEGPAVEEGKHIKRYSALKWHSYHSQKCLFICPLSVLRTACESSGRSAGHDQRPGEEQEDLPGGGTNSTDCERES